MIRFGQVNPEADIVYNNNACKLKVNNGEFSRGQLLLTNSEICWKRFDSENGFMIPWEKVTVQAITQQPQRCIYFMIDVSWPDQIAPANGNGNHVDNPEEADEEEDEGNDSDGSLAELTEFYVVPDSPEDVDEIYFVMSKFPEHEEAMEEESDDDDFFDGENIDQLNLNEDDNDRFADAE